MREQNTDTWTVGRHLAALLAAAPESIDRLSWSREQIDCASRSRDVSAARACCRALGFPCPTAPRRRHRRLASRRPGCAAGHDQARHDGSVRQRAHRSERHQRTRRGSSRCSRSIAGLPRRPVPGDHVRRQFRRARCVRVGCRGVHGVRAVVRPPNNGEARGVRRHTRQARVGCARRRGIADARNRDHRPADGRARRSGKHVSDPGNAAVRGDRPPTQRRATVVPRRLPLRARASRRRTSIGSVVHRAAGGQRDQRTAAGSGAPFDRRGIRCADHQHVRFERRTVRRERGGERRDLLRRGHLHRRARRRRQPSSRAGRGRRQGARDQPCQPRATTHPLRAHRPVPAGLRRVARWVPAREQSRDATTNHCDGTPWRSTRS